MSADDVWFVSPRNEAASRAIMEIAPNTVFSDELCTMSSGKIERVNIAQISEADLKRLDGYKGLAYDTFFRRLSGEIQEKNFDEELERRNSRNRVSGLRSDPFKKGRAARKKAGLPRVFRASTLLRR